jgi:hypothetical protein
MITMKNKERFAKEIVEIACKGHDFRVDKNTNEVADCCDTPCTACLFLEMDDCDKARREWAESEYIEKPVISKGDKAFLEYLREERKYIARDGDGKLCVYSSKPVKEEKYWYLHNGRCSWLDFAFDVDFPMVKWEDSEPWLIEDLKRLEVVDSYE